MAKSIARSALIENKPKIIKINSKDAGFIYDSIVYNREHKKINEARKQLLSANTSQYPLKWWEEIHLHVRDLLSHKEFNQAYKILLKHSLSSINKEYANAELLAGWIALKGLKNPEKALKHFDHVIKSQKTSRTKIKALYRKGETLEALKMPDKAHEAYQEAAKFGNYLYGQFACLKINKVINVKSNEFNDSNLNSLPSTRELLKVAELLGKIKEIELAQEFLNVLAKRANNYSDGVLLINHAKKCGNSCAIKTACGVSTFVNNPIPSVYPQQYEEFIPKEINKFLVLSIVRRESAFNSSLISCDFGHGLMQLMPKTASEIAKNNNIKHLTKKMLLTPNYNLKIGCHYLTRLLKKFDNNYPLAIAAYNAGPAAVQKWVKQFGDPKKIGVLNWIELIPYKITRSYVRSVLEDISVYQILNNKEPIYNKL